MSVRRVGALAIGSNSVRMLCANLDGHLSVPVRGREETALFLSMDSDRRLSPEGMRGLCAAVGRLSARAGAAGAGEIYLLATSAVRDAQNAPQLAELLKKEQPGLPMKIISGDEEALLSFIGASLPPRPGLRGVIDIGGGSCEIAVGSIGGGLAFSRSLQLGASRLLRAQRIDKAGDVLPARMLADEVIKAGLPEDIPQPEGWSLVGGTGTALLGLQRHIPYGEPLPEDAAVAAADAGLWLSRLAGMSGGERAALAGMPPGRLHILPTGLAILCALMERLRIADIRISQRNNLDGFLYRMYLEEKNG